MDIFFPRYWLDIFFLRGSPRSFHLVSSVYSPPLHPTLPTPLLIQSFHLKIAYLLCIHPHSIPPYPLHYSPSSALNQIAWYYLVKHGQVCVSWHLVFVPLVKHGRSCVSWHLVSETISLKDSLSPVYSPPSIPPYPLHYSSSSALNHDSMTLPSKTWTMLKVVSAPLPYCNILQEIAQTCRFISHGYSWSIYI